MKINHTITAADLFKGTTDLAAGIVQMKGASKAWHILTHKVAASAVVHAHLTGDIRPIQGCLMAMPAGAKTNSMRRYFETFAPVKWSDTTKKFKFKGERQVVGLIEGADNDLLTAVLSRHWSSMGAVESADTFKPFDLQAKLLSLVKSANKALEGDDKDKQTVKPEDLNKVAALIRELFPNGEAA